MQRLLTKSDRENSRNAQFESLIKYGYEKTEYKNLVIFTHTKDLVLKTFWGTSANHTDFYRYKTTEAMNQKVKALKELADYREQWKKEQKEKNKGYKSSHAATAAAIRAELKTKFPGFKFSVTSECFSMGDSVHISWTDGPQCESVNKFVSKYQYGHFNGMEDIYENSNMREDIPQAKYVQTQRGINPEIIDKVAEELQKVRNYTPEELNSHQDNPRAESRRILYHTDIPQNFDKVTIDRNEKYPSSREFYKVNFLINTQLETKENQSTGEEKSGKIQLVDYSDKSFAVIGEFSQHYENLIRLGGKYNKFLKCGRGIIFSKSKLEDIKNYLISSKNELPK